jgi:adenylosuccinate synthase
VIGNGVVVHL